MLCLDTKTTNRSIMTNIWGWATTSLHISSFTPFSWQPSSYKLLPFYSGKMAICATVCLITGDNIFSTLSWTQQTPIYPPGHVLPSLTMTSERPSVWGEIICYLATTVHTSAALEWSSLPGGPPFFVPIQLPIWTANWQHQGDLEQSLSGPGLNNPSRWETVITARRLTESGALQRFSVIRPIDSWVPGTNGCFSCQSRKRATDLSKFDFRGGDLVV